MMRESDEYVNVEYASNEYISKQLERAKNVINIVFNPAFAIKVIAEFAHTIINRRCFGALQKNKFLTSVPSMFNCDTNLSVFSVYPREHILEITGTSQYNKLKDMGETCDFDTHEPVYIISPIDPRSIYRLIDNRFDDKEAFISYITDVFQVLPHKIDEFIMDNLLGTHIGYEFRGVRVVNENGNPDYKDIDVTWENKRFHLTNNGGVE